MIGDTNSTSLTFESNSFSLPSGMTGSANYAKVGNTVWIRLRELITSDTNADVPVTLPYPIYGMSIHYVICDANGNNLGVVYSDDLIHLMIRQRTASYGYLTFSYPTKD